MFMLRNVLNWILNYKVPLDKTQGIDNKKKNLFKFIYLYI